MSETQTTHGSSPRIELRAFDVTIPAADGEKVAAHVSLLVPMEWDESIGEWLLTPDALDEIEATKARHMGLLSSEQIFQLRSRLGLTQAEIGELLKIGSKTWTRWETGKQRPSQSMNLLLRALQTGIVSIPALRQLGQPQIDWSAAVTASTAQSTEPYTPTLPWPEGLDQEYAGTYEEAPLAA